jgi:hypothetical protein
MELRTVVALLVLLVCACQKRKGPASQAAESPAWPDRPVKVRPRESVPATVYDPQALEASPADYRRKARGLRAGDTLTLAPGDYRDGLRIRNVHGREDAWVTIQGSASEPTRFLGDPRARRNTITIDSSSYVAVKRLLVDGQGIDGIQAINASGTTHHILIEECRIRGHSAHQAMCGIAVQRPAWNWTIRRNVIEDAGTGMYLGHSGGRHAFSGGLIEHNLILDTRGYCVEIKFQKQRNEGMPTEDMRTIIRHNVFLKDRLQPQSGARPSVLVDPFPPSGPGSNDWYEIYGNVFGHNHSESLLQVAGRAVIHDNVFLDCRMGGNGDAIFLNHHNGPVRRVHVYNNTFYMCDRAVHLVAPATEESIVVGNLMFTDVGIRGAATRAENNLVVPILEADRYVSNPSLVWGEMDFHPRPDACRGPALALAPFSSHTDFDLDFNGMPRRDETLRGAYGDSGTNPGWRLHKRIKGE